MKNLLLPLLAIAIAAPLTAQTIDQDSPTNNACMAGFGQVDLAQSFIPAASNSSGAGIFMSTGFGSPETLTIELWDALPTAGGVMMASGTGVAFPGAYFDVFWAPVAVTPGNTYFLVFSTTFTMCYAGATNNPYPFGQVYANPGFGGFPQFDYTFHTYTGGAGGFTLSASGVCPGPIQISLSGASANGAVAFAYGPAGSFVIPSSACAGTSINIASPTLAGIFSADASGNFSVAPSLPAGLCGLTLQAVDMTTCGVSNAVVL
ncbi:MAG: hypothetical protein O3A50_07855 [Planctomycetota bacterium]|nr:hypothetical protein [Planctomycetota bacterium]